MFCSHLGLYWLSGKPGFSQFLSPAQTHAQTALHISTYPCWLPRRSLTSRATHMIFEVLQPVTVFTFGFPHFGPRLDLKQQTQVRALHVVTVMWKSSGKEVTVTQCVLHIAGTYIFFIFYFEMDNNFFTFTIETTFFWSMSSRSLYIFLCL